MRSRFLALPLALASVLVAGSSITAAAHCCHDERMLGVAEQDGLRRGTHNLGDRHLGDDFENDGPTVGRGLEGGSGLSNGGGLGSMHGNNVGNYGGGSIGERGPGGLGALRGDAILNGHPRPR